MKKIYSFGNAIRFFKKGIGLLFLVLLWVTAYSNPVDKGSLNSKREDYSTDECRYILWDSGWDEGRRVSSEAGSNRVNVSTNSSCFWTVASNATWITITSGQNTTGPGSVGYSYTENTATYSRAGTITVAGKTYNVTQDARPLSADRYEPNNTLDKATLLTPAFTQNAGTLSISPVNCHHVNDVDIYKIELGADSYKVSAVLYDWANQSNNSSSTLDTKISYSTNGSTWSSPADNLLPALTISGGTLYIKIEPNHTGQVGSYAAKIDVLKITADCTYALSAGSKQTGLEAGSDQVTVTTGAPCVWTATSNVEWITLTSGPITTGTGNIGYSYTKNTTPALRTGTITVAGHTYTVTQSPRLLSPDAYEGNDTNNTVNHAFEFTPTFSENASTIDISQASCHDVNDVDIYKINLGSGSYRISGVLYNLYNQQINHSRYTLCAKISYSTNGSTWESWGIYWNNYWTGYQQLSDLIVQGGSLYFKIESYDQWHVGSYAVTININRTGTAGCTYSLSPNKQADINAGSDEVTVTPSTSGSSSCYWAAFSNVSWLKITSGANATSSGKIGYSYPENMSSYSRTGKIMVANQTYTVTQAGRPLSSDSYEENNTLAQARLLTPTFSQNVGVLFISANCHTVGDVDFYKMDFGTDACTINSVLYDAWRPTNSNYDLHAQISYSTNGTTWSDLLSSRTFHLTVLGGTLYFKIWSVDTRGSYAVKINLFKTKDDCEYSLSAKSKQAGAEAGSEQITVTTTSSCAWTAISNDRWITLTSGQSTTGSGNVGYSYAQNSSSYVRTGTIWIADQTYTVTQEAGSPLTPDGYEPNNTTETAYPFTPEFTQNASTFYISPANTHRQSDIDFYKINLETGYFYTINIVPYNSVNQISNEESFDNPEISFSTNGTTWSASTRSRLPGLTVQGGDPFYLKIGYISGHVSSYAAKINITATAGCTYNLSAGKRFTSNSGFDQVNVTANLLCPWTANSKSSWITLTSGQSATGSGNVGYSYTENTTLAVRTGTIVVANQPYLVTQRPRSLSPDEYEPNNSVESAFVPPLVFTQNASTINISSANCHEVSDVDFYKINLGSDYFYSVNAILFNRDNRLNYTLSAKISYSIDNGSTWNVWDNPLRTLTVRGPLYLKIEPQYKNYYVGSYAAKIDIKIVASSAGCTFDLSPTSRQASSEAGSEQITITTGASCFRTAFTDYPWITLTSGQSATGSGNVGYSYTENTTSSTRTGVLIIAGQSYKITQTPRSLSPDSYEPNDTVEQPRLLTPTFTENVSTINISPANCHRVGDVDIYKINLETDYIYRVIVVLYDKFNSTGNNNYTLDADIYYSTDGSRWRAPENSRLPGTVQGPLYLKIVSWSQEDVGSYAAKIEISKVAATGCTYSLSATSSQVAADAGIGQVVVTTAPTCFQAAASNTAWITVTTGQATGSGNVKYSYNENMSTESRNGTINIAGQTYTLTQDGRPLSPDRYEPNNTIEQAWLLTPTFAENKSSLSISSANCHEADDVDIYKINLGTDYSYTIGGVFYCRRNQINNSNYTLDPVISYSTDGSTWKEWWGYANQFPNLVVPGTLYLKIKSSSYEASRVGSYAVKLDITAGCTYSLSVPSVEVGAESSNGKVKVKTPSACTWNAKSGVDWITVTSASGKGDGEVAYSIAENTVAERTGTIAIEGQTFTIKQSLIAGIETTPAVKIFPNPARDFVTIDLSSTHIKCASIKISNQLGQILYEQNNPNEKMQIPLKGLTAGLYFIFLQGEEKIMVQKLVVE